MSQRGSASLPVSRASSQSPRTVPPSSTSTRATLPVPAGAQDDASHNPVRSPAGMASGDGSGLAPQSSRPRDAHRVMLNPPDPGAGSSNPPSSNPRSGSEPPPLPPGHGRVLSGPPAITTHQQQQQQQQQPSPQTFYYRPSLGVSVPTASTLNEQSRVSIPGQNQAPPTAASPPPALDNPRTGPSLQPPTARSIHNPDPRGTESPYTPRNVPSLAGTKRPFDGDAEHRRPSPPARPLQPSYPGPAEAPKSLPPAAGMLRTTPSRSFSQPVHPGYQHSTPAQAGAWPQQHHPTQLQAGWEQGATYGAGPLPAVRDPQGLAPGARAALSAPGTPSILGSGLSIPETGLIPFTIDMTSGSGAQTKKRKKNAEASSRHRKGKKAEKLQLEQEVASLRRQLGDAQQECEAYRSEAEACRQALDFYRKERDRLKEVVLRTPSISEASRGPPSPPIPPRTTHTAAFREDVGPHNQPAPQPSAHAMAQTGYAASQAPDATERVSRTQQTQRTDRTSDMSGMPYGQHSQQQQQQQQQQRRQTPTHEPPQPSVGFPYAVPSPRPELPGYTIASSRPASASSSEMLPPLRTIGAAAMEPGAPPAQRQHYGGRAPYETGFLHAPREPAREPPREP